MTLANIEVRKLTPVIGAEVFGIDLGKPLSDYEFNQIHDALMKNLVIFFRDQNLTPDQHKDVGRRFGNLERHAYLNTDVKEHPEIWVFEKDAKGIKGNPNQRRGWHADLTCNEKPPLGSVLAIQELPEGGGGDTMWASMYAAYDALSEPVKNFISGLTAVHDGRLFVEDLNYKARENIDFPIAEHPIVRTHPVTGRKGLFVNAVFTNYIPQLNREESDAILDMLYYHIERPEFACRFKWEAGSVAIWDNRCTQHNAIHDYYPNKRRVHRVTICGDKPV